MISEKTRLLYEQWSLEMERSRDAQAGINLFIKSTIAPGEGYHGTYTSHGSISYCEPRIKKNGQPGKICSYTYRGFSPLFKCELCHKISTPKKVGYRFCMGYSYLCMGCWNKLRPVEKKERELEELAKLTRKLRSLSTNHRNNQNEKI